MGLFLLATVAAAPLAAAQAQKHQCDLNKDAHLIMEMCCPHTSGHRRSLQSCQLPHTCPSAKCATFYGDFYSRCRQTLNAIPGIPVAQYNSFEKSCQQKFPSSVINPNSNGEIPVFDSRNQCNMDQRIDSRVMNTEIRSIRVITLDGSTHRWHLTHTTLDALLKQPWHGIAGENDKYKLLAEGPNPGIFDNLYMFNDGDARNYDSKGCPQANMKGPRQDQCPGTPDGLISMAFKPGIMQAKGNKQGLTGDYGACNVKKDWKWLVVAMYVTPSGFPPPPPPPISSAEILAFDNTGQCWVNQQIKESVMNRRIRSIRVQRVDGKIFRWDVLTKEGTLHELLHQEWHGIAGENDGYKLLAGDSPHPDQNLYLFNDGDTANYDLAGCARAGTKANYGKPQIKWKGTPIGLLSMGHHHTKLSADYGETNYRKDWGWVVRKMWVTPMDLPGGESFEGCFQDCGTNTKSGGTMNRICDDKITSVRSVDACHKTCGNYRYMGFACPMPGGFECWCCNALDADHKGNEGRIPDSECAGGKLTSGITGNTNTHCTGFTDPRSHALTYNLNGYYLGGACRAEIYNVVAPKVQELSFQGCYQDCGSTSDGGVMNRVCDDTKPIRVTSVGQCHAHCMGYTYLAMACPMPKGFECWCCNHLDSDSKGRSGLIPERECRASGDHELSSGIYNNKNAHCSGFGGAGMEETAKGKAQNKHDWGGFLLGGACRAAVYNVVEPANVALNKPTLSDSTYGPSKGSCGVNDNSKCVSSRAVDGDTTSVTGRWLSTSARPHHWLVVNLQRRYTIQRIKLYAGYPSTKGPPGSGICYHTISVWTGSDEVSMQQAAASTTGWATVMTHAKETVEVEHVSMKPTDGRLVRLWIDQSKCKVDSIARIFELEVFGTPSNHH